MRYIVGVDIGGTFTDCVVLKTSDDGTPPVVRIGKSSSTPPDFQTGFIGSLRTAAELLACDRCGQRYCGVGGDYKTAALIDEAPVTTLPSAADPTYSVDEPLVLRRFCCPGCHVQVCAEVTKADEPVKAEMIFS